MKKQLIVVVHGVGVRDAGAATGQLSAALGEAGMPEPPWQPHSTDDFMLHEDDIFAEDGLVQIFPAHVRRLRRYDLADPSVVRQERLVADFYWGDISATGNGLVRLLIGLVKIVLGLSHAIRDNAMDVFPGKGRVAVGLRRIARTAPLVIHGPIAAISIVLVVGLLWTLGWHGWAGLAAAPELPEAHPVLSQLALGLGIIGLAYFILTKSNVFLQRHLMGWLMVIGGVVIVAALAQQIAPDLVAVVYDAVDRLIFGTECTYRKGCVILSAGFVVLGAVLMGLMIAFWVVVVLAALVVQIATWAGQRFPGRFYPASGPVTPIVAPAIALMTVLWFLLMMAVWSIILLLYWLGTRVTEFHLPLGLTTDLVYDSLRLVTPAVATLGLVGLAAVIGQWGKIAAFRVFTPASYLASRDTLAERHRMIVGRGMLAVLSLFPVAMVVMGVISLLDCQFLPTNNCSSIQDWNKALIPGLLAAVGVVALAVVLTGRRELATGVAIVTDVLVYLNDYSWRSREAELDPATDDGQGSLNTRTMTEHMLGLRRNADDQRQGYWLRGRIQSRMKVLIETLIRDEKPDHLVIVSHSQGTVIALDAVAAHGLNWLRRMNGKATLKLVTMGSPYSHIYNRYFPSQFEGVHRRAALAQRAPGQSLDDGRALSDWVNIFRVDDFVGTHIDTLRAEGQPDTGTGWPREAPVRRRGHSNYWIDATVFPALVQVVTWNGSD